MNERTATKRGPRKPRKVTPESLRNAALHYLERYATSAANLRTVLQRRVRRAARFHETDEEAAAGWIDSLVTDFEKSGLLDDATYAEGRVRAMHRQGRSLRRIRLELRSKGVDSETIEASLAQLEEDQPAPDRAAAIRFARRRRAGPFRPTAREENRERDLAALARAGFDYETARDIVDAEDAQVLEDELNGR